MRLTGRTAALVTRPQAEANRRAARLAIRQSDVNGHGEDQTLMGRVMSLARRLVGDPAIVIVFQVQNQSQHEGGRTGDCIPARIEASGPVSQPAQGLWTQIAE